MNAQRHEKLNLRTDADVVLARQSVRQLSVQLGFSLVDQTKIVTAASELARNTIIYGGGGTLGIETLQEGIRKGLRLQFEDHGPGIADVAKAMTDGYTTGGGLGLGLSGTKRLVNEFEIFSQVGEGTRVTITKWK